MNDYPDYIIEDLQPDPTPFPWYRYQALAIASLALLLLLFISVSMSTQTALIPSPSSEPSHLNYDLLDKINPNIADWPSLTRLPDIGPARAQAIIQFRENFTSRYQTKVAFTCPADLQRVKGIGPKTTQNITPYLDFSSPSCQ